MAAAFRWATFSASRTLFMMSSPVVPPWTCTQTHRLQQSRTCTHTDCISHGHAHTHTHTHTHTHCISHGPAHTYRDCISHGPIHTHLLHTDRDCISHGPAHRDASVMDLHTYTHSLHQSWTCYTDQDWVSTRGFPLYTCTMNTSIVSPLIVSSSNTLKKCLAKVKAIKFKITWTVRYWNIVLYNFGRATQRYPLLCHGRFGSMTLPWQVFLQKNLTHIFHRTFSSDIAIFNIHLKKSYNNKKATLI